MALHKMTFTFLGTPGYVLPCEWSHTGVVASGDMEVLISRANEQEGVQVSINTPSVGLEPIWEKVLTRFIEETGIGDVSIKINDNNATPFVAATRLRQAVAKLKTQGNSFEKSFFEANARERAQALIDPQTYSELAGPEMAITSPHLAAIGEAVSFDDGVVTAVGSLNDRTVFVISLEGRFVGGTIGEVGGAKIVGALTAALSLHEKVSTWFFGDESRTPAVIFSFDTNDLRPHEANASLLAQAEIMELFQACRGKIPIVALVGGRAGCFGGMASVAAAADVLIMSELGRIGLTSPQNIEAVMGKKEFDHADRSLVYRTTGGKHRFIMGDCTYFVEDTLAAFVKKVSEVLAMPLKEIISKRTIGTPNLTKHRLQLTHLAARLKPSDASDVWAHYGNTHAANIPEMSFEEFTQTIQVAKGDDLA